MANANSNMFSTNASTTTWKTNITIPKTIVMKRSFCPYIDSTFKKSENKNVENVNSSWFIRLSVKDEPGVLATIAGLFGENSVSIESVIQEGRGDNAELVLVTHEATENNLNKSIESIKNLDSVSSVTSTIRVYI